jgi:hypothetical protein
MPGSTRVGRTLAYWSNGWQMASLRPHSVMLVVLAAPVEVVDLEGEAAVALGERLQHFDTRRDDLGPDAVSGDRSDGVGLHVGCPLERPLATLGVTGLVVHLWPV